MACRAGKTCLIQFNLFHGAKKRTSTVDHFALRESTSGKELYEYIEKQYNITQESFKLYYLSAGKLIDLSEMKDKTMSEVGVDFSYDGDSNDTNQVKDSLLVTDPTEVLGQRQPDCDLPTYNNTVSAPNVKCFFIKSAIAATSATDATDAASATDTTDATDATNATDTTNSTDVANSTDEASSTNAANSTEATNSTDATNTTEATDAADTANRINASDTANGTDATDTANGTDAADAAIAIDETTATDITNSTNSTNAASVASAAIATSASAATSYVGLVNQAMTCYLNSLLQALYMTPEFRNALYNWEYVEGSEKYEANSIPYQLQKLFLNLQTSTKSAVETTSLTKSFGWDSTQAWQQHDIQELCRVMFDALELKFKNTEQADLINRLYEGKMIDYVKCLECGTEKSREDTFLDIPLPVRSFGSNVAYNSVEEAIAAFVQYETLEGNNQYHCEKCNKKCDAHKGLKFTKFPYLLTLHLKRFDFDFKTCHRIKLNDKVTFPDTLNLNSFISSMGNQESSTSEEGIVSDVKCDDRSTTDSGTLDDNCPPCENNLLNSNHSTNHDQDDDEGIDINNGPSTSNCSTHNHENEKNHSNSSAKGPYQYELFSIMIHSGSASGGHYYAYIKDFRTQQWFCFNDQSVTQITYDDIQKTYGGGPIRAYYSGAYSSSTNAYMLMYRQIDPTRNALPIQVQDFPKHIQELLKKMKENENVYKKYCDQHFSISKLKVYCRHPIVEKLMVVKLSLISDITLKETTERAYKRLELEKVVSLDQCRLVTYDPSSDFIICSYEGRENEAISNIWHNRVTLDVLLEIRRKDQKFETYLPGGVATKVYVIDGPKEEVVFGPISVRGLLTQTVKEYKEMLGKVINMDPKKIKLISRKTFRETKVIENDDNELQDEEFFSTTEVFIPISFDTDNKPFHESSTYTFIETLKNVVSLQIQLPDISKEILEDLNIPSLDNDSGEKEISVTNSPLKISVNETQPDVNSKCNDVPKNGKSADDAPIKGPFPLFSTEYDDWVPEQSKSEDSSLSDSDKTLVGDAPEDDDFQLQLFPAFVGQRQIEVEKWDVVDNSDYYFRATRCNNSNKNLLKVLVDKSVAMSTLKQNLEQYVGVPADCFNLYRHSSDPGESQRNCFIEQYLGYVDGERLKVKLERSLPSDKLKLVLYQLCLESKETNFLCEWIISQDMLVGQAKKEILAELKRKHNIDIPYDRCRFRKKAFGVPTKVLLDDGTFENLQLQDDYELIIQQLPDKEPVTHSSQVLIFVNKWSPSKMTVEPCQEIVMDGNSMEEMMKKISAISDIPEKYIEIARSSFLLPCNPSVSLIQELPWNEYSGDGLRFEDGSLFFYRDSRETTKDLSSEDLKELSAKKTLFPLDFDYTIRPGARRERSLRINMDAK